MLRDSASYARDEGQGTGNWQAWSNAVVAELNKALNGEVSPREAGIAATRAGDPILAKNAVK